MLRSLQGRLVVLVTAIFIGSIGVSAAAQENTITGIWRSIGYGIWFTVEEDAVNIYQTTAMSCLHFADVPEIIYEPQSVTLQGVTLAGVGQGLGAADYQLTLKDDLLNFEVGKLHPIQAVRAEALPPVCDEITPNTPETTFETFWHLFNENFAFFDVRDVDWQSAYEPYRPMITPETTEEELFSILQEMVAPLGDGHVSIIAPFNYYTALKTPGWLEGMSEEELPEVALSAITPYLIDEPRYAADEVILYGNVAENVGYINITAFEVSDTDMLAEAMTDLLAEFANVKAIIIDIRLNPGGDDTMGMFIAGHFTDDRHLVSRKSVWFEDAFHSIMEVYVEPTTDAPFTGDVYLLTSRMSLSAAETFTLAMKTLPNVTIVGESTNGMLSDSWFVVLPNGWAGTLSNEQYLSDGGVVYEGVGVPPDIEMLITAEDFAAGHDPILESVLELTQAQ